MTDATDLLEKSTRLEQENELLREENRLLKAKLFGATGEKRSRLSAGEQPSLFDFDEAEDTEEKAVDDDSETTTKQRRKPRGKRKPIPDHFPRREIIHDIPEDQKTCACGSERKRISEEVSEQIDVIPARVEVIKHIRPKYACPCCEGAESSDGAVIIAPPPKQLIPKSLAAPGLLAGVITAKFADAIPFYRHEKQLERLGISVSRTLMSNWAEKIATFCRPLMDHMHADLLDLPYLQIDETTLRVHNEPERKNTTKSYVWAVRGGGRDGPQIVLYHYNPTRSGDFAKQILNDYAGLVHSDAYSGYQFLEGVEDIVHLACWAHARRKFADFVVANKNTKKPKKLSNVQSILKNIGKIYKAEAEADEQGLVGGERIAYRYEHAIPEARKLKEKLDDLSPKVPSDTRLGKAVSYMLNHWTKLMRCFDHSEARLDTNLVENAIRPVVLGRKNWLHAGSPKGAVASTILFSMIETAKQNGWEPYAYLRFLFERLPEIAPGNLASLLPYNAKPLSTSTGA
jgi:transposase